MSDLKTLHATLTLKQGYEFVAEFPDVPSRPEIHTDEHQPLGQGLGPNPADLLGAAVGNCLAASLAFCLRKSRATVDGLTAHVVTHIERNEHGKMRISGIDVELESTIADVDGARLDRCEQLFEDFCIVTESVRHGIPVNVKVKHEHGVVAGVE